MAETAFRRALEASVDKDVTERRPQLGLKYRAFVVHPRQPGPQTLAIGHCAGGKIVVDLIRDGLTVQQAADLCKAYGVFEVTGQEQEGFDVNLAQAVLGVIKLLEGGHG